MGDREALKEAWIRLQQRLRVQSLTPPEGAFWDGQNGPNGFQKRHFLGSCQYG